MKSDEGLQPPAGEKWAMPAPQKIPLPTYAPLFLALGITFLLFGVVSMYIFCYAGLALIIWSISKWVGELFHEWR
jgi:hypothetical protein